MADHWAELVGVTRDRTRSPPDSERTSTNSDVLPHADDVDTRWLVAGRTGVAAGTDTGVALGDVDAVLTADAFGCPFVGRLTTGRDESTGSSSWSRTVVLPDPEPELPEPELPEPELPDPEPELPDPDPDPEPELPEPEPELANALVDAVPNIISAQMSAAGMRRRNPVIACHRGCARTTALPVCGSPCPWSGRSR